jgi:transposase-like protein
MNIKRKAITAEQKSQIISQSYAAGCVVSQLAKSYGILEKTLYGWLVDLKNFIMGGDMICTQFLVY